MKVQVGDYINGYRVLSINHKAIKAMLNDDTKCTKDYCIVKVPTEHRWKRQVVVINTDCNQQ